MRLSSFGEKFTRKTGILELMEDLALASAGTGAVDSEPLRMLGGGNPARIPEMETLWRGRMADILSDEAGFGRLIGAYDSADGMASFRAALASLFRSEYGWDVGSENVCVTNGSQVAVFYILNLLSGADSTGRVRRILFPLMPEYVGYADQALSDQSFLSVKPRMELRGEHGFKYFVDLDKIESVLKREGEGIGGICVSRPTNPTGNVLTDAEVRSLSELSNRYGVPLIVDNAYGLPFPGIVFTDAEPYWDRGTILSMSLSKIGLPSTRTGIVVADASVVRSLSSVNAVAALATGTMGQAIVEPLISSGEILRLSTEVVRPYYENKRRIALEAIRESFEGLPVRVHESEGAIFLWLWFDDERMDSRELYRRAKARNVLVLPGEYFSFGVFDDGSSCAAWDHPRRCIRINYSAAGSQVSDGLAIVAQEARSMLSHGR